MSNLKRIEDALLFLTLLFLPTQLGKHFWPDFSYIYSLKIDYLSPTVYFWDLLAVSLIIISIMQRKRVNKTALNLFLLFILSSVLSLIPILFHLLFHLTRFNINYGAGIVLLEQYFIAGLFGVYVASLEIFKYKLIFFYSLGAAVLIESIIALGQFLSGKTLGLWILGERTFTLSTPAIAKFDYQGLQFLRPYATFPHPNVLAGFFLVSLILILLFFRKAKDQIKLAEIWVIFIAAISAIFLTVSRTALISGFIMSILLSSRKMLIWMLILIGITSPILYTRFSSVFSFDNLTILRREELGEAAFNIFSKNPIFGAGLNNFIPAASDRLLVGPSRFLQPVHNIFLLRLSETGIVGFMMLLILIGYPVWRLFKRRFRLRSKQPLARILLVAWLAIFSLGLFDHYFLTLPQGYRLFFLVWGLSFGLSFSGNKG